MSKSSYGDKYLYFTFNDIHSSKYNLFITNKGGDQILVAAPDKQVNFTTPEYQNNTYYLGTTKKQKTFKHNVAAEGLTWTQVQEMLLWLDIGTKGFLFYDRDCFWGWDVVVSNVSDVTYHEIGHDYYIVEFTVEFKTYGDWHARSSVAAATYLNEISNIIYKEDEQGKPTDEVLGVAYTTVANPYGIPELVNAQQLTPTDNMTDCYDFLGVSDSHSFIDVRFTGGSNSNDTFEFIIEDKTNLQNIANYNIQSQEKFAYQYYGRYGFLVDLQENNLIENTSNIKSSTQSSQLLEINNIVPIQLDKNSIIKLGSDYYLDYKYYSQLPTAYYIVKTHPIENNDIMYNMLGNIHYSTTYSTELDKNALEHTEVNGTVYIVIHQKIGQKCFDALQNNTDNVYLCGFTTVQITAPNGFVSIEKHNNNN